MRKLHLPKSWFSSGSNWSPHDGCQGCGAAMSEAAWSEMGFVPANGLFAVAVTHRPGRDSTSAGAELMRRSERQAILASTRVHRNSVPSVQMHCKMMAILRATAMRAFLPPTRFASLMPHAFSGEKRSTLVSNTFAAS